MQCAKQQGFGREELMSSFGVRADRILQLLLVPVVCSSTAVVQMFLPGTGDVMSLLRSIQLAFAMGKLIELLFILNGSQQQLVSQLPTEPQRIFAKPPFCCFACPVVPQWLGDLGRPLKRLWQGEDHEKRRF